MKYKTFIRIIQGSVAVLFLGAGAWVFTRPAPPPAPPRAALPPATDTRALPPPAHHAAAPASGDAAADYLLQTLGRPADDEKKKDVLRGPVKVNLYAEGGTWVRAKVDRNRNEKWDEKWSIKDGVISRELSSRDDESYDRAETWSGTGWAGPGQAQQGVDAVATPDGLREVDAAVMTAIKGPVRDKVKDATKGRPYKINLYSSDNARFDRAKVDLDRDDRWDETWTFGPDGSIERQVSPSDDETYTETWVLKDVRWARK